MDTVIKIGDQAPLFKLANLHGDLLVLEELGGQIVVLNFWSAECEWCQRVDQELLTYLAPWKEWAEVLWIASNASESRQMIDRVATERRLPTVFLDGDHMVADLYGVQTTPHFYVVDSTGKLAYQGAWNDITFRHRVATQVYVPRVIEALKLKRIPEVTQTPPYGCALVRF